MHRDTLTIIFSFIDDYKDYENYTTHFLDTLRDTTFKYLFKLQDENIFPTSVIINNKFKRGKIFSIIVDEYNFHDLFMTHNYPDLISLTLRIYTTKFKFKYHACFKTLQKIDVNSYVIFNMNNFSASKNVSIIRKKGLVVDADDGTFPKLRMTVMDKTRSAEEFQWRYSPRMDYGDSIAIALYFEDES